mmetsp:Transcript_31781/g.66828  ORF Transcript_31781/g.66828 Transcript_31781/m.66828 type:complete len:87 (+) Transcript_31781:382-642(+)
MTVWVWCLVLSRRNLRRGKKAPKRRSNRDFFRAAVNDAVQSLTIYASSSARKESRKDERSSVMGENQDCPNEGGTHLVHNWEKDLE